MTQILISGIEVNNQNELIDTKVNLGVDANGEDKIAGECTACGKWAGSIISRFDIKNIYCKLDFYREWRRKMWEQSTYDAVLNLVGAIRDEQPTTISNVALYYNKESSDILWEISSKLRGWKAITLMYGFEERIFGLAESKGSQQPCILNEKMYPYIWGNNVFLQSKTFIEYLSYAQSDKGLLPNVVLPKRTDADYDSKMIQGNLRADGVV